MTDLIPGEHDAAAVALATAVDEAARGRAITADDYDRGLVVRLMREGERFDVVDLEHTLNYPNGGPRGTAVLWDPADFASYVNRLGSEATTVWHNPAQTAITAVFDDHENGHIGGWRRHRATLDVQPDPEWTAWRGVSGRLMSQEDFAEFLEDHHAAVIDPDAATMLEIATTFSARRSSSFERGTRLTSGDVQFRYTEQTSATAGSKGHLEIPAEFTVSVSPFRGVDPVTVKARLRYRINDGNLKIGFVLHRPDLTEREAFDRIRAVVIGAVAYDHHLGEAPPVLWPPAGQMTPTGSRRY